jgi:hypothetical protein
LCRWLDCWRKIESRILAKFTLIFLNNIFRSFIDQLFGQMDQADNIDGCFVIRTSTF